MLTTQYVFLQSFLCINLPLLSSGNRNIAWLLFPSWQTLRGVTLDLLRVLSGLMCHWIFCTAFLGWLYVLYFLNVGPVAPNDCFFFFPILFHINITVILALLICNTWCDSNHWVLASVNDKIILFSDTRMVANNVAEFGFSLLCY